MAAPKIAAPQMKGRTASATSQGPRHSTLAAQRDAPIEQAPRREPPIGNQAVLRRLSQPPHPSPPAPPPAAPGTRPRREPVQAGSLAPPLVHDVLASPGQAIDPPTRAAFESRFGHDFGRVRVHTGTAAAASAAAVGARAYTVGPRIVFGANAFAPDGPDGHRLIAHELAHVVQQRDGIVPRTLSIADPAGSPERRADAASRAVLAGRVPNAVGTTPVQLARDPTPEEKAAQAAAAKTLRDEIQAIQPPDIRNQWAAKKDSFLKVANDPDNTLSGLQMYQIWLRFWMDIQARVNADFDATEKKTRASMDPVVYVDKRMTFDIGKHDALGPEFQLAAERKSSTQFVFSDLIGVHNWLETFVDTMRHPVTIQQVNEKAAEMARTKANFQLYFAPLILGMFAWAATAQPAPAPAAADPAGTQPGAKPPNQPGAKPPAASEPAAKPPAAAEPAAKPPAAGEQAAKPAEPALDPGEPVAEERPTVPAPAPAEPDFGKSADGYSPERIFRKWLPAPIPAEGWKLHVSADAASAPGTAQAVLPVLRGMKVGHKVVGSAARYGQMSPGQAGKFITVYPETPLQAQQVVAAVDGALAGKGLKGVAISGERPVGSSGMVQTRYGGFTKDTVTDPTGKEVPDVRGTIKPDWIPDPWAGPPAPPAAGKTVPPPPPPAPGAGPPKD